MKNRGQYVDLVEKAQSEVYKYNKYPRLVDYEKVVADLKCKKENLPIGSYKHRQVHKSVWEAIKFLVSIEEMKEVDGKHYYGLEEYNDFTGRNDLLKVVFPEMPKGIFTTPNTFCIKLKEANDHEKINSAILKYFGKEVVYASYICDNVLTIILTSNEPFIYHDRIQAIFLTAYTDHQNNNAKKKNVFVQQGS